MSEGVQTSLFDIVQPQLVNVSGNHSDNLLGSSLNLLEIHYTCAGWSTAERAQNYYEFTTVHDL